jgi:uncharacterized protein (TIGR03435 family)
VIPSRAKILNRSGALAVLAISFLCGQSFDVASIRSASPASKQDKAIGLTYKGSDSVQFRRTTVANLLQLALGVRAFQIVGPAWITADRFDLAASFPPNSTTEQFNTMLVDLLVERFAMRSHHENRPYARYRLSVGKSGVKMRKPGIDVSTGSGLRAEPTETGFHVAGAVVPILQLVTFLEGYLRSTGEVTAVIDETGLEGGYLLDFSFARDIAAPNPSGLPDLFRALEQDLGLKLGKVTDPLDTIVIDSINRQPSEN